MGASSVTAPIGTERASASDNDSKHCEEPPADSSTEVTGPSPTSRVWGMHEGIDALWIMMGSSGALLVGAANPVVGVIFVECMDLFYDPNPDDMREKAYKWAIAMFVVS